VDIFNGIKLAAGGELGIGVGEEEWGSGEREVLEDFVSRTDGLVDIVAARFGDAPTSSQAKLSPKKQPTNAESERDHQSWLGSDQCPQPSDGVIFCGVGAISRSSLCRVSHWMEWIYRYGDAAYGVGQNPSSIRRRKHKRRVTESATVSTPPSEVQNRATSGSPARGRRASPGIPPPLVTATPPSSLPRKIDDLRREQRHAREESEDTEDYSTLFGTETLVKYLTLGYGSSWRFSSMSSNVPIQQTEAGTTEESNHTKGVSSR
jgi:hypothetical protein